LTPSSKSLLLADIHKHMELATKNVQLDEAETSNRYMRSPLWITPVRSDAKTKERTQHKQKRYADGGRQKYVSNDQALEWHDRRSSYMLSPLSQSGSTIPQSPKRDR
jgi:hypothetical protein